MTCLVQGRSRRSVGNSPPSGPIQACLPCPSHAGALPNGVSLSARTDAAAFRRANASPTFATDDIIGGFVFPKPEYRPARVRKPKATRPSAGRGRRSHRASLLCQWPTVVARWWPRARRRLLPRRVAESRCGAARCAARKGRSSAVHRRSTTGYGSAISCAPTGTLETAVQRIDRRTGVRSRERAGVFWVDERNILRWVFEHLGKGPETAPSVLADDITRCGRLVPQGGFSWTHRRVPT